MFDNDAILHNHSEFSLFDGAQHISEMVQRAEKLGCRALALTDHGTMIGIPKFVAECRKKNIKPIIGVEIYLQNTEENEEKDTIINKGHSCLYAVNDEGYRQLCKIMSDSEKNQIKKGKSVFPITTMDILRKYVKRGDVIYTTACVGGYIPQLLSYNYRQEKNRTIIEEKLKRVSSPKDEEYILLQEQLRNYEQRLKHLEEEKKDAQTRSKQTYKKKENAAMKLSGTDRQIALKNVEDIKTDIEQAKVLVNELSAKIKTLKQEIKEINEKKSVMEKEHKQYKNLCEKMDRHKPVEDTVINEIVKDRLNSLTDIFGKDNIYVELQYHNLEIENYTFNRMIQLSEDSDIKCIVANDAHMSVNSEENIKRRQILSAQRFGKWEELKEDSKEYYIKSNDELYNMLIKAYPEDIIKQAVINTNNLADRCNVTYDFGSHPPVFPVIPNKMTSEQYLHLKAEEGKAKRYPDGLSENDEKRFEHELDTITSMGFADYHLIVQDYINKAKTYGSETDYNVGPGRGSAAGSMVCYCLGITNIDPLKYGLLFERFLNPERVSMPDIDVDFARGVRPPLIQYCKDTYGENNVCQISTIGTQKAKASTKNYANVLALKYAKENGMVKNSEAEDTKVNITEEAAEIKRKFGKTAAQINGKIPRNEEQGRGCTLKECKEYLLKTFCNDTTAMEIINGASLIEDFPIQYGIHAAGVIISDNREVTDYLPLRLGSIDTGGDDDEFDNNSLVIGAQCDKVEAEEVYGLLKMDFLGLRNLNIISQCGKMIKERYGITLDYDNLPIEQEVIEEIYAKGNTTGVFQFESPGAKKILKDFKPTTFEDLILINAANRPGPIEYIPEAIEVKNGNKKPYYMIPEMADILDVTYGKPFYQEQLMQLFSVCAGFSMGEADIIRRYMSKKKVDKFMAYKDKFIDGCVNKGAKKSDAEDFWNSIVSFSKYAFNKSHAACYTWVSYQTAYIKYHYPEEFICASINYDDGNKKDFMSLIYEDCKRLGIKILPPNINRAKEEYSVVGKGQIMAGFSNIKGMKSEAQDIITCREKNHGRFMSVKDYVAMGANGKFVEKLIKCGSFDCFNENREATLILYSELITAKKNMEQANEEYKTTKSEYSQLLYKFEAEYGMYDKQRNLKNCKDKNVKKTIMQIEKLQKQCIKEKELYKQSCAGYKELEYPDVDDIPFYEEEKELLGMYISGNPLDCYPEPSELGCVHVSDADEIYGRNTKVLVSINSVREFQTQKGETMAFVTCSDDTGTISAVVFPNTWMMYKGTLKEQNIVILSGKNNVKDEKTSFIVNMVKEPEMDNGEIYMLHVDTWNDWNINYYPKAQKLAVIKGATLYVHNRKNGEIIKFSKKIKKFDFF